MARTRAALRQKKGEGGRFERNYRNVHPCISISSCATPRIFHLDTPTIVLQELRFFRCVVSPHTFRLRNNKIYSNFATQYYYSNTHTHKDAATKSFDNKQKHTLIAPAWRIVLRKHAREHVNTRKLSAAYGRRRRTASLTRARQDRLLLFLNRRVDADRTPCCSSVLRRWMNDMHCTCVRVRLVQIT